MATQMKSFLDGPNRTVNSRYPQTDLLHEVHCRQCPNIFDCSCTNMKWHQDVHSLNLCYRCLSKRPARKEHDPRYDPNDEMDQGGGVGGESTFGPYRERSYRR